MRRCASGSVSVSWSDVGCGVCGGTSETGSESGCVSGSVSVNGGGGGWASTGRQCRIHWGCPDDACVNGSDGCGRDGDAR